MFQGFPGDSVVKNLPADVGNARDTGSIFGRKIPWSRKWQPLQYSCLENSMDRGTEGQRSQVGYSSVAAKSRTQLSTEQIYVVYYFTVNHFNFYHLKMDFIWFLIFSFCYSWLSVFRDSASTDSTNYRWKNSFKNPENSKKQHLKLPYIYIAFSLYLQLLT